MGERPSRWISGGMRMKRILGVACLALLGVSIAGFATYVFAQTPPASGPTLPTPAPAPVSLPGTPGLPTPAAPALPTPVAPTTPSPVVVPTLPGSPLPTIPTPV